MIRWPGPGAVIPYDPQHAAHMPLSSCLHSSACKRCPNLIRLLGPAAKCKLPGHPSNHSWIVSRITCRLAFAERPGSRSTGWHEQESGQNSRAQQKSMKASDMGKQNHGYKQCTAREVLRHTLQQLHDRRWGTRKACKAFDRCGCTGRLRCSSPPKVCNCPAAGCCIKRALLQTPTNPSAHIPAQV